MHWDDMVLRRWGIWDCKIRIAEWNQ